VLKEYRQLLILVSKAAARRVRELLSIILPFVSIHRKKYFVVEDLKVIYIPVSKAANTSVKVALLNSIGVYEESKNPYSVHQDSQYAKYTKTRLPRNYKDYFLFTVVRNPEDRLRSCYENKFLDIEKISKRGYEFSGYLGGYLSLSDEYHVFLKKLSRLPNRLKDEHFVSQYYWVCDLHKANPRVYDIGDIDQCMLDISLFSGKTVAIENKNKSDKPHVESKHLYDDASLLSEHEQEFVNAAKA
jgi:sulfotransferase famil protein